MATLRARYEVITPDIAATWLEANGANRHLDQGRVEQYAQDMKLDQWEAESSDPIRFGASGRLLDGQHRLWACVFSGATFTSLVVRGITREDEVLKVIDTGKKRTLGNALQIEGHQNANVLAAIINMCWRYDADRLLGPRWPTHSEAMGWLEENPQVVAAVDVSRSMYKALKVSVAVSGAAYYLNAREDAERSEIFWQFAASGLGLNSTDMILTYRSWLIGQLGKREKASPYVQMCYALKAMNLWLAGRSQRILVWKPEEGIPEIWGSTEEPRRSSRTTGTRSRVSKTNRV